MGLRNFLYIDGKQMGLPCGAVLLLLLLLLKTSSPQLEYLMLVSDGMAYMYIQAQLVTNRQICRV